MGLTLDEQETTIQISRDGDIAKIYTSDSTMITRLDKLAENEAFPLWKLVEEHRSMDGALVGKSYETNKRCISFRSAITKRELTDEQRELAAARLAEARRKKAGDTEEDVPAQ